MKSMSAADLSQPKLPPQNLEAEQSVLGAILLDKAAMPRRWNCWSKRTSTGRRTKNLPCHA